MPNQYNPQGIIDAGVGTVFGLALGAYNDDRQYKQQERLQGLQIRGQKEMSDYQYQKQMDMWNATNYGAQVEHLKKAGLNPALLYGMKGGGGVTTGSGGGPGVQGGQAPQGGREVQDIIGMGIQSRLLQAQEENIRADTELKKVDATKKAGVDTAEAGTRIQMLEQGIDNERARFQMMQVETRLKLLDEFEKISSQTDRLDYIAYQTEMAMKALEVAKNEAYISTSTINEKIKIIEAEAIGAALRNSLTEANIQVSKEQINKWKTELAQGWETIDINKFKAEIDANYPGAGEVIGKMMNTITERLGRILRGPTHKYEKIEKTNR